MNIHDKYQSVRKQYFIPHMELTDYHYNIGMKQVTHQMCLLFPHVELDLKAYKDSMDWHAKNYDEVKFLDGIEGKLYLFSENEQLLTEFVLTYM